jgi:hypothetical protein
VKAIAACSIADSAGSTAARNGPASHLCVPSSGVRTSSRRGASLRPAEIQSHGPRSSGSFRYPRTDLRGVLRGRSRSRARRARTQPGSLLPSSLQFRKPMSLQLKPRTAEVNGRLWSVRGPTTGPTSRRAPSVRSLRRCRSARG